MANLNSSQNLLRLTIAFSATATILSSNAAGSSGLETIHGREVAVLETPAAHLEIDLAGGSISQFRLAGTTLNPLSWLLPGEDDTAIHAFGHFLCLDRWGPPSVNEERHGMPYHGEASHVRWSLDRYTLLPGVAVQAELKAKLPIAGLSVRRVVQLSQTPAGGADGVRAGLFTVREEVTNDNPLGRIYNMVQHPTIGAPFLDSSTVVDCNGKRGFAQGRQTAASRRADEAVARSGECHGPNGKSQGVERRSGTECRLIRNRREYGWITAATPAQGLLIGYVWLAKDYPWVSVWRDVHNGQPAARGLEFGTTGLHQPFPILVEKGRIWDRPLFEYIDAGQTKVKQYASFSSTIPSNFAGVQSIEAGSHGIVVHERAPMDARSYKIAAEGIIPSSERKGEQDQESKEQDSIKRKSPGSAQQDRKAIPTTPPGHPE